MNRFALVLLLSGAGVDAKDRVTVPLDGAWQIQDSVAPEPPPAKFAHTVPVPGLANLAQPAFPLVDAFESRELIMNRIRARTLPKTTPVPQNQGTPGHERNYLWYRKSFRAPAARAAAWLKVNKAQFGTSVWINGKRAGDHLGCFTAGWFDLTKAIRWGGDNELMVRIGAHPAVLPVNVISGMDYEKLKWTPGIYDSVSVHFMDQPAIVSVQVAPRIADSSIVVETVLRNAGPARTTRLAQTVEEWKGGRNASTSVSEKVRLGAGETKTVRQTVRIPSARLWSPEDPFLYVLKTFTSGDSQRTRFGMREFRFDSATRRAYLNGKPRFLRGSNITLHRFFEDPQAGALAWDEQWVRKLLVELPKKMHWDSLRFCIGPVPERWLDIADEAGLLIQNEYFIWTGGKGWSCWRDEWDMGLLTVHFREWMRDNWNHASLVLWDASNESLAPLLKEKIIPGVRGLDLSQRPWDNGYNPPDGENDPVEYHAYFFQRGWQGKLKPFSMTELETFTQTGGTNAPDQSTHAVLLNEYGWLWVNRDGSPTALTGKIYEDLHGPRATPAGRLSSNAYLVAGETEFWRSLRKFAGVLHFVYLTSSYPGVFTSDHFRDVARLQLQPEFADWVGESFKPLGVYVNFWQPSLKAGSRRTYQVVVINDYDSAVSGRLRLVFEGAGGTRGDERTRPFEVPAFGRATYEVEATAPERSGNYTLKVTAQPEAGPAKDPTLSRRLVRVE